MLYIHFIIYIIILHINILYILYIMYNLYTYVKQIYVLYIYINKTQVCVYVLHSDKKQKTQLFDKFSNSFFIF